MTLLQTTPPSLEVVQAALDNQLNKLAALNEHYDEKFAELNANITKLRKWLWDNEPHTADSLVEAYVAMRDERAEIKARYENKDDSIKERMEQHEIRLMEMIDSVGAESLRTNHGTAYVQIKTRANCADWPTFWAWIAETGRFDMLEKRVSQKPIADMINAGNDLPPAINVFREREVTVRRS